MSLEALLQAVIDAEDALLAELAKSYPVGCRVIYRLRAGLDEAEGEVVEHQGGREGRMRVLLAGSKRGNFPEKRYVTSLPLSKIVRRI